MHVHKYLGERVPLIKNGEIQTQMTSEFFWFVNECVYTNKLRYCPTVFQETLRLRDTTNMAEIFKRS